MRDRYPASPRARKENRGLSHLLEIWSDDDSVHHRTLRRLRDERYTRMDAVDAYAEYRMTVFERLVDEIKKLRGDKG